MRNKTDVQNGDILGKFKGLSNTPKETIGKFPMSGHLIDQQLKNEALSEKFDFLDCDIDQKEKGEIKNIEASIIGIDLDEIEDRVIKALACLLNDLSYDKDKESINYLMGNLPRRKKRETQWGEVVMKSPMIAFKRGELYKKTLPKGYGGSDKKRIDLALEKLTQKKFIFKYTRKKEIQREGKKKENRYDIIKKYAHLVVIEEEGIKNLTETEVKNCFNGSSKEILVVSLSPIFIDNISTKYINFARSINQDTVQASPTKRVSKASILLRDYLSRARSNSSQSKITEISEEKLIKVLKKEKWKKEGRRKKIEEEISKAIAACLNLRLIEKHKITNCVNGKKKYVFYLTLD